MALRVNPLTGSVVFDRSSDVWRDPSPDAASLPLTGNLLNDTRVTIDTGILHQWDGTQWVPITPDINALGKVETFTLSSTDIANGYVTLIDAPGEAASTSLNVHEGPTQFYGIDFTISGQQLSWTGLGLDGILSAGDKISVEYI